MECGELPAFLGSPGNPSDAGAHLTASLHSPSVPQPVTNNKGNMLMTSEKPKGPRTPGPTGLGPMPDPVAGIVIFYSETSKPDKCRSESRASPWSKEGPELWWNRNRSHDEAVDPRWLSSCGMFLPVAPKETVSGWPAGFQSGDACEHVVRSS